MKYENYRLPGGKTLSEATFEDIPVSYTHLDVYKRQAIRCDLLRIVPLSKTETGADDPNNIPPNKQPIDVYKRQE